MQASSHVDLLVIGGGINGAGIARDAAGRGLSVALCEQQDFASATSSASTKLIHGGLRYLEHREFRLVGEALAEREVLLKIAPHISWPLRFVMPHVPGLRPGWMIRLGLLLYDHLGGAITLPKSRAVALAGTPYGAGLKPEFSRGYVYSDGWVDDARLVILNLRSAEQHGARILPRTRFIGAVRKEGMWHAQLQDSRDGSVQEWRARMLVNAAGPWVDEVAGLLGRRDSRAGVRLVKGSHIVVPRLYAESHAYILQDDGGKRIFFMIPYERDFTLIGTTDVQVEEIAEGKAISDAELRYLCDAVSRYARRPVTPEQVVWSYSGVRPLYDDGSDDPSAITRDYTLVLDDAQHTPLLSVYGGKITTYRKLAEAALSRLAPWMPHARGSWTGGEALPGGDLGPEGRPGLLRGLEARYPLLPRALLDALSRRHGKLAFEILGDAQQAADLGEDFGGGLFEREARYLIEREWACDAEDILWRRTKTGLHMSPEQRRHFAEAMEMVLSAHRR
jgi:glycerol-3-phosphate dehydrogenase